MEKKTSENHEDREEKREKSKEQRAEKHAESKELHAEVREERKEHRAEKHEERAEDHAERKEAHEEHEANKPVEDKQDLTCDIEEKDQPWYKRKFSTPEISPDKLALGVKIFAVLCCVGAFVAIGAVVLASFDVAEMYVAGKFSDIGLVTIIVTFLQLVVVFLLAVCFLVFGVRLFRGQRHYAALVMYATYILTGLAFICSLMLHGVTYRLILIGVLIVLQIAFQTYLDPNLRKERIEHRKKHDAEIKQEQEDGTLGRDRSGKGYIELNFFNLFWIFVVASFLGDIMESIVHITLVDPGHWQDRAGVLYGQFSPIYGFGALLMTLFLNRFYKSNIVLIFLASAVIGGAFEYFVSWFMQYAFGAVAWNYTGQFLSIGGRTCGWAMGCWGLLGVLWIKVLLPLMLKLINLIPWNWRYIVTTIAAVFMVTDGVMSLIALDCWYERLAGDPVVTPVQQFCADVYDNQWMENRFQSMTINPDDAVRHSK